MNRQDEKKFTLDEYSWHLLNNLSEFNDKPDLIRETIGKVKYRLPEHTILSKFYDYFDTAIKYYDEHGTFPDIQWFEVNYAKSGKFKRTDNEFSIKVYEDFCKKVDLECLKKQSAEFIRDVDPPISTIRRMVDSFATYCDNSDETPLPTKVDLINMYDDYSKEYVGIYTGIPFLDEKIGVLGSKSVSVFGAPSGHGKSTFAISVTYNVAVIQGKCVDYISYEVPKEHIWFNLVSIHSQFMGPQYELPATDIKEAKLTDEQKETFKVVQADLLQRLKESGGFINVLDQTTAHVETFEGLMARLESIALERRDGESRFARKADLMIVDNVDNFQILKSSERDEMVRVNNYIIKLDAFSKQYYKGEGTAVLLLTQLNRGGLTKLNKANMLASGEEQMACVDVTVFQKFNALYEKGTVCLVGYSNPAMRMNGVMQVYPVKLRNKGVPTAPINLRGNYAYSVIGTSAGAIPPSLPSQTRDNSFDNVKMTDTMDDDEDFGLYDDVGDLDSPM